MAEFFALALCILNNSGSGGGRWKQCCGLRYFVCFVVDKIYSLCSVPVRMVCSLDWCSCKLCYLPEAGCSRMPVSVSYLMEQG